jgi:hypothetical protein
VPANVEMDQHDDMTGFGMTPEDLHLLRRRLRLTQAQFAKLLPCGGQQSADFRLSAE